MRFGLGPLDCASIRIRFAFYSRWIRAIAWLIMEGKTSRACCHHARLLLAATDNKATLSAPGDANDVLSMLGDHLSIQLVKDSSSLSVGKLQSARAASVFMSWRFIVQPSKNGIS